MDATNRLNPTDVYPARNLPGPSEQWGRSLEQDVVLLKETVIAQQKSILGLNRALAAHGNPNLPPSWGYLELEETVTPYSESEQPRWYRSGGYITLQGAVSPANSAAAALVNSTGGAGCPITNLAAQGLAPAEAMPQRIPSLQQGSGTASWFSIYTATTGMLGAVRYRGGTAGTSTWLTFLITYPAGDQLVIEA